MRKKILCFTLTALFIVLSLNFSGFTASANNQPGVTLYINTEGLPKPDPPDITASDAIIMDAATGDLIYEKNSRKVIAPASTVKIMTAILVLENVEDLETQVTISRYVTQNTSGNALSPNVSEGEIFTVGELLYALLLRGANDAALALAQHVSENVPDFVARMNEKARRDIGCVNTFFTNPTGIDDVNKQTGELNMYTTVSDMAKIVFYASKIQKFMDIACMNKYVIPPTNKTASGRTLMNRNHFVSKGEYSQYFYENAKGINFGSTAEAGLCLTTLAEKKGLSYLGIVMGSTTAVNSNGGSIYNCFYDAESLFEWIFAMYESTPVVSKSQAITSKEVKLSSNRDVITLIPDEEISVMLPVNADINKLVTIQNDIYEDKLVAPISKGDVLGKITVIYNGEIVGTANLLSNADFEHSFVLYVIDQIWNVISSVWFRASVIIFAVIFAGYIGLTLWQKKRAEQKRFY